MMRGWLGLILVCFALGGCATSTERRALQYGDYLAMSCDQLGQQAVWLMHEATDRSEHILKNDQERRRTAMLQLKAVKQARAEKQC